MRLMHGVSGRVLIFGLIIIAAAELATGFILTRVTGSDFLRREGEVAQQFLESIARSHFFIRVNKTCLRQTLAARNAF